VKEETVLSGADGGVGDTKYHLFHIHGTTAYNTRAMEIECKSENLNSADTFVLCKLSRGNNNKNYVWLGSKSEPIEKDIAKHVAKYLTSKDAMESIEEGSESADFWKILGGKKKYATVSLNTAAIPRPPRLFHCWNAKGFFDLEEINNFTQDDLLLEDIYILDVFSVVFVWVGTQANSEERLKSMELAVQFVERATKIDKRSVDIPIIKVIAGEEPPIFTCWFQAWEAQKAGIDIFKKFALEQQQKQREQLKKASTHNVDVRAELKAIREATSAVYPYSRIRVDVNRRNMPDHIDMANLEKHLTEQEFQTVFSMKKAQFYKLPLWKQENMKGDLHLF